MFISTDDNGLLVVDVVMCGARSFFGQPGHEHHECVLPHGHEGTHICQCVWLAVERHRMEGAQ